MNCPVCMTEKFAEHKFCIECGAVMKRLTAGGARLEWILAGQRLEALGNRKRHEFDFRRVAQHRRGNRPAIFGVAKSGLSRRAAVPLPVEISTTTLP